jgi:hypothetical protein
MSNWIHLSPVRTLRWRGRDAVDIADDRAVCSVDRDAVVCATNAPGCGDDVGMSLGGLRKGAAEIAADPEGDQRDEQGRRNDREPVGTVACSDGLPAPPIVASLRAR